MMTKEELQEMITGLTQERDEFVQNANRQIAYLNGKIELLTEMVGKLNSVDSAEKETG